METGYLPVTFCGKISSDADPVAFMRARHKMQEFRMRSLRGWLLCIVFQKKIDPFFDSYPPRYENNIWLPLPCCFEFQFNSVMIIMMMRVTKVEYKEDWTIDCKDRRGKIWKRNGACYN